jgi:hypothetical protein
VRRDPVAPPHPTLVCLDIQDPSGMARLLAEPVKGKLPIGV